MKFWKKHGVWIAPVLLVMIVFLMLWGKFILDQHKQPIPGWSRSVNLPVKTNFNSPYIYHQDGKTYLYSSEKKTASLMTLNASDDSVIQRHTYTLPHEAINIVWGHEHQFIYRGVSNLYAYDGTKSTKIASGINTVVNDRNNLYFTKGNQLYEYEISLNKKRQIATLKSTKNIILSSNGKVLVISEDSKTANLTFFTLDPNKKGQLNLVNTMDNLSNGDVLNGRLVNEGNQWTVFFTLKNNQHGMDHFHYYIFHLTNDSWSQSLKKHSAIKEVHVYNPGEQFPIGNLVDGTYHLVDNKPVILFANEGMIDPRNSAQNIYMASQDKSGKWIAERISTTKDSSDHPFLIDQQTIGWIDYNGYNLYQMLMSSQKNVIIQKSLSYHTSDFTNALSDALLSIPRSMMYFLFSVGYALPLILLFLLITVFNIRVIEGNSPIVKYTLIAIFILSEIFFHLRNFTPTFKYFAPAYLSFPFAWIIVPCLLGGIAWGLLKSLKNEDWGMGFELFYFTVTFIIIDLFLIGPYTF